MWHQYRRKVHGPPSPATRNRPRLARRSSNMHPSSRPSGNNQLGACACLVIISALAVGSDNAVWPCLLARGNLDRQALVCNVWGSRFPHLQPTGVAHATLLPSLPRATCYTIVLLLCSFRSRAAGVPRMCRTRASHEPPMCRPHAAHVPAADLCCTATPPLRLSQTGTARIRFWYYS